MSRRPFRLAALVPAVALAAGLSVLPGSAHAFPVAEGAGALSSLAGVIAASMAGAAPGRAGLRRRTRWLVGAIGALVIVTLLASALSAVLIYRAVHENRLARQSRPALELTAERAEPAGREIAFTARAAAWAQARDFFLDLDAYRAGDVLPDAPRVQIDHVPGSQRFQPWRVPIRVTAGDAAGLLDAIRTTDGPVILLGQSRGALVAAGQRIARTPDLASRDVRALWTGQPAFFVTEQTRARHGDWPAIPPPDRQTGIFEMPLVDIRPRATLLETHTLATARNVPLSDILLMRDSEIDALLGTGVVFTGYDTARYPLLHARLRADFAGRYAFLAGGLEAHYFDQRNRFRGGLTPPYPNKRLLDPWSVMRLVALRDDVRFVCTTPQACPSNIPREMRVTLPFRDLDRAGRVAAVAALDPTHLHIGVSSDQESTGNVLIAGFYAAQAGVPWLGEFTQPSRFSLERVRMWVLETVGRDGTLAAYRDHHALRLAAIDGLGHLVATLGWAGAMIVLGVGLRLALWPAQRVVTRGYYGPVPHPAAGLGAATLILAAVVGAYFALSHAVSMHFAIPAEIPAAL